MSLERALPGEKYLSLQRQLQMSGELYEDSDFPPNSRSLFTKTRPSVSLEWKRPKDICRTPKFFTTRVNRTYVAQGRMLNCWFVAAVASLTDAEELLHVVCPSDQSFDEPTYCGMFRFNFWRFGEWVEVIIDDFLPTHYGRLYYAHSIELEEFWIPLLEKAYAKVCGSYEVMGLGRISEALQDFTGGVTETINLQTSPPDGSLDVNKVLQKSHERNSLMGASIETSAQTIPEKLPNGLISGHAYSITGFAKVNLPSLSGLKLIRLRNPHGNSSEWMGAWSDGSREWCQLSSEERERLNLVLDDDGEFWMTMEDFQVNFTRIDICMLTPDSVLEKNEKKSWNVRRVKGRWQADATAGGCRKFIDTYHINPQIRVQLQDPDEDDDEDRCSIVVSLMRIDRKRNPANESRPSVGFAIYKVPEDLRNSKERFDRRFFEATKATAMTKSFTKLREISSRYSLPPGEYVLVPSTFRPRQEAEFLLSIFSEKPHEAKEIDVETEMVTVPKPLTSSEEAADIDKQFWKTFQKFSGEDGEIDQYELQEILGLSFANLLNSTSFSLEACRSMIAMFDIGLTGALGYKEFRALWIILRQWQEVFHRFDKDQSGLMKLVELRDALSALGYKLNNTALSSIHVQYHNKKGTIPFDIFIQILMRVIVMFEPLDRGVARFMDSNTPLIPAEDKEMEEVEEVVVVAQKNQEKADRVRLAISSFLQEEGEEEEEEETDEEEEKKRLSFFQESPSGSMAKMQVNVEMDDLTKEEDNLTIEFVQPNRKGNDNGDGFSDRDDDSVGDGKGNDDGKGEADGDGDNDDDGDGNRNGQASAHVNAKENLTKIIERGNIDEITEELTTKAMAKCGRNALLVAMEANSKLRSLAKKEGPGAEEFAKMASSVDEFTSCLLDPLKSNMEARHVFGDSLDDLMDAGIDRKQKTFFAHPVIFNLMSDKWLGKFGRMKRCSWLSLQGWLWIMLHIWCLFDFVMFPFLYAVFYIKHRRNKNKLKGKGIEIAFVLNATSKNAVKAFNLMTGSIKEFVDKHGDDNTKYQVVIHGDDSSPRKMCSKSDIAKLELKRGTTKIPALHEDLKNADFLIRSSKKKSEKVIIFFTDHKISLKHERGLVENQVKDMKDIKLLPVAIGPHVNIRELETITDNKQEIIHFGEYEKPETVSKRIWHELQGKDMYESYHEYFTTPYFIFVRDTLSYLTLLGLHIALCLSPSVIPFNGLEWVILVFFLGRILMESKQFQNVKVDQGRGVVIKKQMGNKYTRCSENEEQDAQNEIRGVENGDGEEDEGSCRVSRSTMFAKMCGKYLSDRWNILDSITLVIYLITLLLRMLTWATAASVTNNRALVIASYLYGLNTMFLTLRAFGHVMETVQGIGTIQIALFQIIGDIATIFWQFVATILAFSIAITKVYMAEKSYIAQERYKDNLACNTSGISCWWAMFKHLCWSLLGIAELDPLDSVDNASVTLAQLLFGAFLIMGVVLLVNMMIALLSNTYQRVEDNAYKEWSFKKAITIQTYSSYHSIPVPLNLISNLCVGVKSMVCCKGQEDVNDAKACAKARNKSLNAVVQNLQQTYFATYGYSFPLTDDRKMDQLIQETERNREMFNQIAHRTFTTNAPDQGMLPTGPKAWQSQGIRIEGSLLVCEGGNFCDTCQGESDECHGARYLVPFSPEFPHLEVLIQETGEQRCLGVGVVWKDYGNHAMPGQTKKTVGYLVDEGKILGPFKPVNFAGKEYEGAMAYRGDLIGCTVMFNELKDGKVPIQFTLNGKQITQDKILIKYNPAEKSLYPFIGMGHTGIRMLAKLCPSPNDDAHLIGTIKATTESMREKMTSNWNSVDEIVELIKGELDNADTEFEILNQLVLEELRHFENLINDPDQLARDEAVDDIVEEIQAVYEGISLSCHADQMLFEVCRRAEPVLEPIREKEISHLNEKDGPGLEDQQPQNSLLKVAHENLEELTQTAESKFTSVLASLKAAKNEARDRLLYQKVKRENVETNLRNIQESLKDLLRARLSHSGVQSSRPNYLREPQIQMQVY